MISSEYSSLTGGNSFFKNLNSIVHGHMVPVLTSIYSDDSVFFYEKTLSSRVSSYLFILL